MLESALKEQLKGIFAGLEANFTFDISVSSSHENRTELVELLGDVADCSDHITCVVNEGSGITTRPPKWKRSSTKKGRCCPQN